MSYTSAYYAAAPDSWVTCADCGGRYQWRDKAHHERKVHVSRPNDTWLTLEETATVLGLTKGELNHDVRKKYIQVVRTPERKRVWVTREAIADYVAREMKNKGIEVMQRLTRMGAK